MVDGETLIFWMVYKATNQPRFLWGPQLTEGQQRRATVSRAMDWLRFSDIECPADCVAAIYNVLSRRLAQTPAADGEMVVVSVQRGYTLNLT